MALATVRLGYFTVAEFAANPTLVLEPGQHLHLSDGADEYVDAYVIGDGTTQLSVLPWRGVGEIEEQFTVSGSSVTLSHTPLSGKYFLDGMKCRVGVGGRIVSVIGTTITFDQDYTGSLFDANYKYQ